MRVFLFLFFLLFCSFVFAGNINIQGNTSSSVLKVIEWNVNEVRNEVVLRSDAYENNSELIVDFNVNKGLLFENNVFPENSFLFRALENSSKEFNLTGVGGECKAVFFQVYDGGIQRHVFASESKVSLSLVKGDKVFFGVIPLNVGKCNVSFNDGNKFFVAEINFKFYPVLYDFIKEKLYETSDCKQTFRNEETGVELCYDEWMAWGCSNEEFLDGTVEAKANCFARQLNSSKVEVNFLNKEMDVLKGKTNEALSVAVSNLTNVVNSSVVSSKKSEDDAWSFLYNLLLGLIFVVVVVFVFY